MAAAADYLRSRLQHEHPGLLRQHRAHTPARLRRHEPQALALTLTLALTPTLALTLTLTLALAPLLMTFRLKSNGTQTTARRPRAATKSSVTIKGERLSRLLPRFKRLLMAPNGSNGSQ